MQPQACDMLLDHDGSPARSPVVSPVVSAPDQAMHGGKDDTNRVKLEVCPGPGYNYGFYN